MAINLKKKVGPLPIWGWALGGAGTIGVVYYLYKSNSSSTTSSSTQTAADLAAEQAAADQAAGLGAGGGGDSGGAGVAPTLDTTGLATGSTSTDQLETDLEYLQSELATLSANAATPAAPAQTIAGEAQDLLAAQQALAALGLGGTLPAGSSAAAKGKATGLPILAQLEDLRTNLLTKSQLGPNAAAALKAAGGNITKAIAARQAAASGAAPAPKGNAATISTTQANSIYNATVATGGVNAIVTNPKIAQKITVAPKLPKGYQGGL